MEPGGTAPPAVEPRPFGLATGLHAGADEERIAGGDPYPSPLLPGLEVLENRPRFPVPGREHPSASERRSGRRGSGSPLQVVDRVLPVSVLEDRFRTRRAAVVEDPALLPSGHSVDLRVCHPVVTAAGPVRADPEHRVLGGVGIADGLDRIRVNG